MLNPMMGQATSSVLGTFVTWAAVLSIAAAAESRPAARTDVRSGSGVGISRPNILFAIADDMGHAGAYGTRWVKTPSFDRLAGQGVLFLNAYTPNAKCSPSRACILTGRNPWQLEAAGNHWPYYPARFKSWMEALADGGYCVGFTGKGWGPGTLPPERRNITGKAYQQRRLEKPAKGISNWDYFANFQDFLAEGPQDRPFCFWYGGHEPHRPYEYGSGVARGGYKLEDAEPVPPYWPDTEAVRNDMLDYAFEIAHFDRQLGKMLDLLAEKGLLDNTLVVATSDNGPPFPRMKGHPFESACHLPLAMMWPRGIAAPGRKTDALVSFIDFAPTFLDVAGVDGASVGMQSVTGTSLKDILSNRKPAADRSTLLTGRERNDTRCRPGTESGLGYPVRALREGDFVLLHNFDPSRWPCGNPELGLKDTDAGPTKTAVEASGETNRPWQLCFGKRPADELYNLKTDADCVHNLADDPAHARRLKAMREKLFARLRQQGDPRMEGHGDVFDYYPTPRPSREDAQAPKSPTGKAGAARAEPLPDLTVAPADKLRALAPATLRSTGPDFVAYVPRVEDGQVGDTGNEHFMVFQGPDKSLMTIWSQSSFEGQGDQHIVFARSRDQGKTWSAPKIIAGPARPGEGFSASWAVPLVSKSGRIYVIYCQSGPKWDVGRNVSTRFTGIYSDNSGKTWSSPQTIEMPRTSRDNPDPSYPPNCIIWQKPARLARDGRYLVGMTRTTSPAVKKNPGKTWTSSDSAVEFLRFENLDLNPEPAGLKISWLAYDKDALTMPHRDYPQVSVCQEPSIVKLPDGRLFCVMRTMSGSPAWTQSRDDGNTWTPPKVLLGKDGDEPLKHPLSPCPIYDLGGDAAGSGRYALFIHNHDGHYQGFGPTDSNYHRRPIYLVAGRFQPGAEQPVWFDEPRFFMDNDGIPLGPPGKRGRLDLAMYASLTEIGGRPVLWYPDRKFFLLGKYLPVILR